MKPDAIKAAAVEVLTEVLTQDRPASEIVNAYTRSRRYIGSKDRRVLTDLVWGYIRHRRRLSYLYPGADIRAGLDALPALPEVIDGAPGAVNNEVPDWLPSLIPDADRELPALLSPADTILRVNGNREQVRQELAEQGILTDPTALSPWGLRLRGRVNLNTVPAYVQGRLEVQDEGSQCVALETGIRAGEKVLDYCAGAGGKSLIFAQMMGNVGHITAHDTSDISLAELRRRAVRAGARIITTERPVRPGLYDHVVVDAPCSGTGTWRRCPDARWKLTPERVHTLIRTQRDILEQVISFVRSGGRLSYMTCSLIDSENAGQVQVFLSRHPDFCLIRQRQFSPARTQTDGLFIAVLSRK